MMVTLTIVFSREARAALARREGMSGLASFFICRRACARALREALPGVQVSVPLDDVVTEDEGTRGVKK